MPQKRSGVLLLAGTNELALGRHDVRRDEVVDGRAVLPHQPPDPAAEGQPCNAGMGDDPADGGQAEELRLAVELAQSTPASARAVRATGST